MKSIRKIYYIDTLASNGSHEVINSALLEMCQLSFDEVYYYGDEKNFDNMAFVNNSIKKNRVLFKKIFVIHGYSRSRILLRNIVGAFHDIRLLVLIPKGGKLFFPACNLFSVRLMNYLSKFLRKEVVICCHGELEFILPENSEGGVWYKILRFLTRSFFTNHEQKFSDKLQYIVFGESILENVKKYLPKAVVCNFFLIEHACISYGPVLKSNDGKFVRMGTVGVMSKSKGLCSYVELARRMKNEIDKTLFLSVIGKTFGNVEDVKKNGIKVVTNKNKIFLLLKREMLEKNIQELDYVLFFYPKDSYKLTASGSVFDAIKYEKPIIAFYNEYFSYLFKKYGRFGYLVSTIEEMACVIRMILKGEEQNKNHIEVMRAMKWKLSPEVLATDFRKIMGG